MCTPRGRKLLLAVADERRGQKTCLPNWGEEPAKTLAISCIKNIFLSLSLFIRTNLNILLKAIKIFLNMTKKNKSSKPAIFFQYDKNSNAQLFLTLWRIYFFYIKIFLQHVKNFLQHEQKIFGSRKKNFPLQNFFAFTGGQKNFLMRKFEPIKISIHAPLPLWA